MKASGSVFIYIVGRILKRLGIFFKKILTNNIMYVILQVLYNKRFKKGEDTMPPKAKITKEMIIEAGLDIVRCDGLDSLNVRSVAARLECSTQPVMYHYKTVDELKSDIYAAADKLHSEFLMRLDEGGEMPMMTIGLNYIRFADNEKNLFRFLFQSEQFVNTGFGDMMNAPELEMIIKPLCEETGLTSEQAREAFRTLFICVHGAASLLANNSIEYDESEFIALLTNTFMGIVGYMKRGN